MIKVRQKLLDNSKLNLKCPYTMTAEYITIHNTYNDATADNEISYMISNNNQTSFHFAIDDKEVIQGLPLNRNGWHCGDGAKGDGNRKSIGIEICYSKSGGERYKKAEQLAILFIAQLLKERNWGIERVKKHQDWSKKNCPHRILDEKRWDSFLNDIEKELKRLSEPVVVKNKRNTLNATGDKEAKELFKKLYDKKIFTTDHSDKVDSYTDGEILSFVIAAINRTV